MREHVIHASIEAALQTGSLKAFDALIPADQTRQTDYRTRQIRHCREVEGFHVCIYTGPDEDEIISHQC